MKPPSEDLLKQPTNQLFDLKAVMVTGSISSSLLGSLYALLEQSSGIVKADERGVEQGIDNEMANSLLGLNALVIALSAYALNTYEGAITVDAVVARLRQVWHEAKCGHELQQAENERDAQARKAGLS